MHTWVPAGQCFTPNHLRDYCMDAYSPLFLPKCTRQHSLKILRSAQVGHLTAIPTHFFMLNDSLLSITIGGSLFYYVIYII